MAKKYFASGGYIETHPSGSYKKVSPSGTVTKRSASGYTETTSPGGSKTIRHVTGRVERTSPWSRSDSSHSSTSSSSSNRSSHYESKPNKPKEEPKVEEVREREPYKPRYTSTKTALENDNKEKELKKYHKSKNVCGVDIYSFIDQKTGEEKWLAYANPSVLTIYDNKHESIEEQVAVLGINDEKNIDDCGRAIMSVKGYLNSDVTILYEVAFDENNTPSIDPKNCYIVHIKSGEMIPFPSNHLVRFSQDGERMRVLNPFAPNSRYDIYSTRIDDKMLESYVDPNEMI